MTKLKLNKSKYFFYLFLSFFIVVCAMTTVSAEDNFNYTGPADSSSPGYNGVNRTGQSEYIGPQGNNTTKSVDTRYDVSIPSDLYISIGSDGTIYGAKNNKVYAFYANNGSVKWNYTLDGNTAFYPAIGNNETIYVFSDSKLYAINYDKTEKWTKDIGSGNNQYISPVIGPDGTIYVNSESICAAFNPDGTQKWNVSLSSCYTSLAIDSLGYLYVGSSGGASTRGLYKINSVGGEKTLIFPGYRVWGLTIGNDGTIYFIADPGSTSAMYLIALNPDGTKKWNTTNLFSHSYFLTATSNPMQSSIISVSNNGLIYSSNLLINAADGVVLDIDTFSTKQNIAIGADGTIYVAESSRVVAFNSSWDVLWAYNVTGAYNPVIDADNTLYFTAGGRLYAIKDLIANFTFSVNEKSVSFTGNSSYDDGVTWHWDFGDGNISNEQNPTHEFNTAGNYTVTLTVTNEFGDTNTYSKIVKTVDTIPPTVSTNMSSGTYNGTVHVYLTISESGKIYYTTNGDDPSTSTNRMLYDDCIAVTSNSVIKYIAIDDVGNPSEVYVLDLKIDNSDPTVNTSVGSGTYYGDINVVLTISESGKIYYTTDGSDPASSATRKEYIGPITISSTTTLRYLAIDDMGNPSQPYLLHYVIQKSATPANPGKAPGSYNKDVVVSLPTVVGSTLYYKLDNGAYKKYTGAFTLTRTSTVSYYYQDANGGKTKVKSVKYTIDKTAPKVKETNTKKYKAIKAKKQTLKIRFTENVKIAKANLKKIVVKTTKGKKIKVILAVKNNVLSVKIPKIAKKTKFVITIPKNIVKDNVGNVLKSKTALRYVIA